MFQIGDSLREARTRRGLSAADVQTGIRIRERYLTALEEEQWEMLPGDAYTEGLPAHVRGVPRPRRPAYIDEYNAAPGAASRPPTEGLPAAAARPAAADASCRGVVLAAAVAGSPPGGSRRPPRPPVAPPASGAGGGARRRRKAGR